MSKIEVKELTTLSGESAITLGETGKKIDVPSGATLDINSGATIINNGTATGFGGGKVLQYKYMTYSTETATSVTNTWAATGFDLDFTPTSATSVLRITASLKIDGYYTSSIRSGKTHLRVMRDSTNVYEIERGYYRNMSVSNENRGLTGWVDVNWVDTPNSTSTINYTIEYLNSDTQTSIFNDNSPGLFEIWEIEL